MKKWSFMAGLVLAVAALAVPAQAFAPEFDDVVEQSLPLPAGGTFALANVNGSVVVEGWDRPEVHLRAVKTTKGNLTDLKRVHIDVRTEPGKVLVQTIYPEDSGVEVLVDYRIRVPRNVRLAGVQTVNGNVMVRGVEGQIAARAVNGDLELADAGAGVQARTTNGNIRFESHRPALAGGVTLETINGSIVVGLPAESHVDLEVTTMNGDFRSELPLQVQGSGGDREFRGRLGRGGSPLQARTVNGGIRVVTARNAV